MGRRFSMNKKKNIFFQNKGLTLVEIIVSLGILGIITVSFTTLFTHSFKSVFSAGDKSVALFEAQEKMENILSGTVESESSDPRLMKIYFGNQPIIVEGKMVSASDEEKKISLIGFIPGTTDDN
jgi:prepilin-type N-terminal cleavage/methylation domain-containing protein